MAGKRVFITTGVQIRSKERSCANYCGAHACLPAPGGRIVGKGVAKHLRQSLIQLFRRNGWRSLHHAIRCKSTSGEEYCCKARLRVLERSLRLIVLLRIRGI